MSKLDASSRSVKGRKANAVQAGVRSISRPAPRHGDEKCVGWRARDAAVHQAQDRDPRSWGAQCPPGPAGLGALQKMCRRFRPGMFGVVPPWNVQRGRSRDAGKGPSLGCPQESFPGLTGVSVPSSWGVLPWDAQGVPPRDARPVPRGGHSRGSLLVMLRGACPVCPGDPGDPALCCSGGPSFSRPPGPSPGPFPRTPPATPPTYPAS